MRKRRHRLGMVRISREDLEERLLADVDNSFIRSVWFDSTRDCLELIIEAPRCPESDFLEPIPWVDAEDFLKKENE